MDYIGTKHEVKITVTKDVTAAAMHSGSLEVFSTPFMVAIMEQAASELFQKILPEGISSVGVALNIQHIAATMVGAPVRAAATLTSFDGRRATFDVEAYDNAGLIGKGTHDRFSIKIDKFLQKAQERAAIE